jgi:hypothetical protein
MDRHACYRAEDHRDPECLNILQNIGLFTKIFIVCRTAGSTSCISALGAKGDCFRTMLPGTTFRGGERHRVRSGCRNPWSSNQQR